MSISISKSHDYEWAGRIEIDELDKVIKKILDQYGDEVSEIMKETTEAVAKKAKDEVKKAAPVDTSSVNSSRSGEYKRGIKVKKTKDTPLEAEWLIYAEEWQLTHLLENGHATHDGMGRTKAQPHFAKAVDYAVENYEKEFKRRLNGRK